MQNFNGLKVQQYISSTWLIHFAFTSSFFSSHTAWGMNHIHRAFCSQIGARKSADCLFLNLHSAKKNKDNRINFFSMRAWSMQKYLCKVHCATAVGVHWISVSSGLDRCCTLGENIPLAPWYGAGSTDNKYSVKTPSLLMTSTEVFFGLGIEFEANEICKRFSLKKYDH